MKRILLVLEDKKFNELKLAKNRAERTKKETITWEEFIFDLVRVDD